MGLGKLFPTRMIGKCRSCSTSWQKKWGRMRYSRKSVVRIHAAEGSFVIREPSIQIAQAGRDPASPSAALAKSIHYLLKEIA